MNFSYKLAAGLLMIGMLAACSSDDYGIPGTPSGSSSARVLDIARSQSDTGEPQAINDGAFAFDDSSDSSEPVDINR